MARSHRPTSEPASPPRGEAGFTLVEVIVAIVLIGASLLTIIAASAAALGYQALARQQTVATTIATRIMEQARALPFSTIQAGHLSSDLSGDGNVSGSNLVKCGAKTISSQALVTSTVAASSIPLNPHKGSFTVDATPYTWGAYVTRADAAAPYLVSVCVQWNYRGTTKQSLLQGTLWSPQGFGCQGRPDQGVGGPCAYAAATIPDGGVAVSVTSGGTTTEYSVATAGASSSLTYAGSAVASASFTYAIKDTAGAIIDQKSLASTTETQQSATTDVQSIAAIPATNVGPLRVVYQGGTGQASSSIASSGTCPMSDLGWPSPGFLGAGSYAGPCAVSGVNRGGQWIEIAYPFNTSYDGCSAANPGYIQVVSYTNPTYPFTFGTRVTTSGTSFLPYARRALNELRLLGLPGGCGLTGAFLPIASGRWSDEVSLLGPNAIGVYSSSNDAPKGRTGSGGLCSSETSLSTAAPASGSCVSTAPTKTGQWWGYAYTWSYVLGTDASALNPSTGVPLILTYDAQAGVTTASIGGPSIEATIDIGRYQCKNGKWDNTTSTCTQWQLVSGFSLISLAASINFGASVVTLQTLA